MNTVVKNAKVTVDKYKKKIAVAYAMAACMIYSMPAYASIDITEEKVTTMLGQVIDTLFELMAAGIGVIGVFQLVPAIIHFVQASQSNNGEQRKEAGSGIGTAVVLLLLAGSIFMLKGPLKTFFGL